MKHDASNDSLDQNRTFNQHVGCGRARAKCCTMGQLDGGVVMSEPTQGRAWKWIGGFVALGLAYGIGYDGGYSEGRRTPVVDSASVIAAPAAEPSPLSPPAQVSDSVQAGPTTLASIDAVDDQSADDAYSAPSLIGAAPIQSSGKLAAYEARPQAPSAIIEDDPGDVVRAPGYGPIVPDEPGPPVATESPLASEQVATVTPKSVQPTYGCAENGTCYGDISAATGRPKTVAVQGYFRRDGTYVRGHYRSSPRR
jgi:hypothetical protein